MNPMINAVSLNCYLYSIPNFENYGGIPLVDTLSISYPEQSSVFEDKLPSIGTWASPNQHSLAAIIGEELEFTKVSDNFWQHKVKNKQKHFKDN